MGSRIFYSEGVITVGETNINKLRGEFKIRLKKIFSLRLQD